MRTLTAFLWSGFEHSWSYNHRINRLGDWIEAPVCDPSCGARAVHAAASGTGADSAQFTTFYQEIAAQGVTFRAGEVALDLRGREGQRLSQATSIPVDPGTSVAVLEGFDLVAVPDPEGRLDADKLVSLAFGVRLDQGLLSVDGSLVMGCRSLECSRSGRADYRLVVRYLLLSGDATALTSTRGEYEAQLSWDRRSAPAPSPAARNLDGAPNWPTTATAFDRLEIDLDREHHLLGTALAVRTASWDAAAGRATVDLELAFEQWRRDMHHLFSFTDQGTAAIRAGVVLLELREGRVDAGAAAGTIAWSGHNRPPDDGSVHATALGR